MSKKTVFTKSLFSIAGLLLLVFSINLFVNTTKSTNRNDSSAETKNAVLSFTSSSFDYIKGGNNINPSISITTESPILINGLNITYSVEGLDVPDIITPDIIIVNSDIIDPNDCSTNVNESNGNLLLSCYISPTKLSTDDNIAYLNLETISKLANTTKIKIKIKDSNSYITVDSADQSISLKTNEFVINIIDNPKECLNVPSADINCDGKINSYDIVLFSKPTSDLEPYIIYRLDLNRDKIINDKDNEMFNLALTILNNR